MAVHNYVLSRFLSGANAYDLSLELRQEINADGRYEIESPKSFIADKIYTALELTIHEAYNYSTIRKLLETDGRYALAVADSSASSVSRVVLTVNNADGIYAYDSLGSYMYRRVYEIHRIEETYLGYLAVDQVIKPDKDCEMIARCYREYFTNLDEAEAYCRAEMKKYSAEKGSVGSGFSIFAVDSTQISSLEWYQENLKIARGIDKYGLNRNDYHCIRNMKEVENAVKADAYDDLPAEEQIEANKYLCSQMLPFIDDFHLMYVRDDIDSITDEEEMEGVADDMILFALLSAKSEEDFDKVHRTLGPYGYRIGALTDSLYNAHPNQGCILMCSDGNMKWYSDCYALNEWQGAAGNPYFGKFQPNEPNDLLCLREYHPELIVDVFPSPHLWTQYQKAYEEELAQEKRKHAEMRIEDDPESGLTVCIGNWYPDGVYSDEYVKDAMFPISYEAFCFSRNQCRQLLSGEELIIPNYESKMGKRLTIRGKLKESFYDEFSVNFMRTDINTRNRNIMNAVLGVVEAGLPPEDA